MRNIQTAISLDLCIRLTWNLTGSCGQKQTSWLVSYGGKTIRRWRMAAIFKIYISLYLGEKSSDFHAILYTAADFELDERHVIKNEKSCIGQTPSSTERISCSVYFWNSSGWVHQQCPGPNCSICHSMTRSVVVECKGVWKNTIFHQYLPLPRKWCKIDPLTMKCK